MTVQITTPAPAYPTTTPSLVRASEFEPPIWRASYQKHDAPLHVEGDAEQVEVDEAENSHCQDEAFEKLRPVHLDSLALDDQSGKDMQPCEYEEKKRSPQDMQVVR